MNGFSTIITARPACRRLLTLVVTGWLSLASVPSLIAQDAETPTPPPAIPGDSAPADLLAPEPTPITPRTTKPLVRKAIPQLVPHKPITRLIPTGRGDGELPTPIDGTGRFGERTQLIPTESVKRASVLVKSRTAPKSAVWAEPEETDAQPTIQLAQAESVDGEARGGSLLPGEGLEAPATEGSLEAGQESRSESFETGNAPAIEGGTFTESSELQAAPGEPTTTFDESLAEPAPLKNRVGTPHKMPTPSHINRTAAVDSAPYNDHAHGREFGAKDTVHTVAGGESFWSISKKYYKLGRYSAALAEYNKSRITKADKIKPGMKIVIPPLQTLEHKFAHLISGMSTSTASAENEHSNQERILRGSERPSDVPRRRRGHPQLDRPESPRSVVTLDGDCDPQ